MMGSPRWAGICKAYDNMYVSPALLFSYLVLMSQPLDALFSTYLPPHHCIFGYLFMTFLLLLCYFVFVILSCII